MIDKSKVNGLFISPIKYSTNQKFISLEKTCNATEILKYAQPSHINAEFF